MRAKTFLLVISSIILQAACLNFNADFNNVWKIPHTNLEIAVYKERTTQTNEKTVERKMILRESHSDRKTFYLQRTGDNFSRVNVYQTAGNKFLVRDSFETYELNTTTKVLQKTTPTDTDNQKFIGTFDYNENGNWRYIPATERAEILLGTKN